MASPASESFADGDEGDWGTVDDALLQPGSVHSPVTAMTHSEIVSLKPLMRSTAEAVTGPVLSPAVAPGPAGSPSVRLQQDVQRSHEPLLAAMKARETTDRLRLSLESQLKTTQDLSDFRKSELKKAQDANVALSTTLERVRDEAAAARQEAAVHITAMARTIEDQKAALAERDADLQRLTKAYTAAAEELATAKDALKLRQLEWDSERDGLVAALASVTKKLDDAVAAAAAAAAATAAAQAQTIALSSPMPPPNGSVNVSGVNTTVGVLDSLDSLVVDSVGSGAGFSSRSQPPEYYSKMEAAGSAAPPPPPLPISTSGRQASPLSATSGAGGSRTTSRSPISPSRADRDKRAALAGTSSERTQWFGGDKKLEGPREVVRLPAEHRFCGTGESDAPRFSIDIEGVRDVLDVEIRPLKQIFDHYILTRPISVRARSRGPTDLLTYKDTTRFAYDFSLVPTVCAMPLLTKLFASLAPGGEGMIAEMSSNGSALDMSASGKFEFTGVGITFPQFIDLLGSVAVEAYTLRPPFRSVAAAVKNLLEFMDRSKGRNKMNARDGSNVHFSFKSAFRP